MRATMPVNPINSRYILRSILYHLQTWKQAGGSGWIFGWSSCITKFLDDFLYRDLDERLTSREDLKSGKLTCGHLSHDAGQAGVVKNMTS